MILQLQTQSISPWHPVGPDGSQRRQPASLPLEASSHRALSVAPRVQGRSSTPASPDAELLPRRPRPRASLAVSLMPAHMWGFFAQPLSWEQAGRSGNMGPRRAGLGQLPRVTARHPPSRQKGTGQGGEGGAGGRPPLHPCPAAGLPQRTEPPPPHGFFPASASVLTDQQVLRKQVPSEAQAGSDPAAAPPRAQNEFPRSWDRCRPAGFHASSSPRAAPHRPAVGRPAVPTQAGTLVSKPKSSRGERDNAGV